MGFFKKTTALIIVSAVIFTFAACGNAESDKKSDKINIGVLNGPTAMGALELISEAESGNISQYEIQMISDPVDMAAKIVNGEMDIASLPTNLAASLYNKTNGKIRVLAINTLGVLHILTNSDEINEIEDLKGRTVYSVGMGSNPEYLLRYILEGNGIDSEHDVNIVFSDANDICAKMLSGEAEVCMLAVPAASQLTAKSESIRDAVDVNSEYQKLVGDGNNPCMGCIVCQKDFLDNHPDEVAGFLSAYSRSIDIISADTDEYASLAMEKGLVPSEDIYESAVVQCNLKYINGTEMKGSLEAYYKILFNADPASIGGAMPAADFYYGE